MFFQDCYKRGVFEVSQDPIIIPQAAYNTAYNNYVPSRRQPVPLHPRHRRPSSPSTAAGVLQPVVTLPLEMKAMHDEMGGVYDLQFGRMSGMLGLTNPTSRKRLPLPYSYSSPPTDVVKALKTSPQRLSDPWRRHADLENLPQRRRHPRHPRPPV